MERKSWWLTPLRQNYFICPFSITSISWNSHRRFKGRRNCWGLKKIIRCWLNPSIHSSWLNCKKEMDLLGDVVIIYFLNTTRKCPNYCTPADWSNRPKPLEEITRVIIRMWFLQESAMRMNGLHESNSKLNIRRYPKAKKTDSDLILLLCPRALCCPSKYLWDSPAHKPPFGL